MNKQFDDPLPGLLWLGAGSLAHEFAGLAEARAWHCSGARRTLAAIPKAFTPLAADFNQLASLTNIARSQVHSVVVTLTPSGSGDDAYRTGYVEASLNLVAALKQCPQPPQRVVFVSSTSVYGQDDGQWVDENSATNPSRYSGQRLLQAEQVWRDTGWPLWVVRFSGIYGAGRYRLLRQVSAGQASAGGASYSNRIHQTDCARVIAHLLCGRCDSGDYIATDNDGATSGEVKAWLAAALNREVDPSWLERVGVSGKRLRNQKLLATGFDLRYPSYREGYPGVIAAFAAQSEVP